ncbi:RNA polymerase sigma factor [Tepidibacter thalassicus]|uniref:RNA polymerase sigma factor n=1 Tax=Tepidibacter thalassicus TaxID=214905 RepID=UPI000933B1A0|nr:sigma-70 family RNA polymerase sigma factor [Tepidibacter thalassicus]
MKILKNNKQNRTLSDEQKYILYKTYYKSVFRTIYYFTRDKEISKELTNEAYIKAFENYESLNEIDKFKSWICTIGLNLAKNYVNKNKKITLISNTEMLNLQTERIEDKIIESIQKENLRKKVRSIISKLDIKYREIIFLRYYDELSYNDISKKLNLNINTVKSRLNRAKEKIHNLIKLEGEYDE